MYRLLFFLCAGFTLGQCNVLLDRVKREDTNATEPQYYDYETTEGYEEIYYYYYSETEGVTDGTITAAPLQQGGLGVRGNGKKKNNNRGNNGGNNRGNNRGGNKKKNRPNRRPNRRPNKRPNRRPNRRPNKRPNKNKTKPPNKNTTEKPKPQPHANIIRQISWKDKINNGGLMIIEEGGHQQFYSLGFEEKNKHLGICFQSANLGGSSGVCRYIRYCMDPQYTNNYNNFFENKCITSNGFVAVCCKEASEEIVTEEPTKPEKLQSYCGRNVLSRTRIVGGNAADPKEYPWMAALITEDRPGAVESFCGGVLITDRHVLTASHCVLGSKPQDFKIRLGEYDFSKKGDTADRDFPIQSITMHEQYNTSNQRNDIAIITLANSTEYNDDIWPICLPAEKDTYNGQFATVVGWGTLRFAGDDSDILMEVVLPIWTLKDCNDSFSKLENPIVSTQICAGVKEGGKDSCQGDSGGPLMHFDMNTLQWKVIGVVSYGYYCATPGYPGIYTKVNTYLDWIHNILGST